MRSTIRHIGRDAAQRRYVHLTLYSCAKQTTVFCGRKVWGEEKDEKTYGREVPLGNRCKDKGAEQLQEKRATEEEGRHEARM